MRIHLDITMSKREAEANDKFVGILENVFGKSMASMKCQDLSVEDSDIYGTSVLASKMTDRGYAMTTAAVINDDYVEKLYELFGKTSKRLKPLISMAKAVAETVNAIAPEIRDDFAGFRNSFMTSSYEVLKRTSNSGKSRGYALLEIRQFKAGGKKTRLMAACDIEGNLIGRQLEDEGNVALKKSDKLLNIKASDAKDAKKKFNNLLKEFESIEIE